MNCICFSFHPHLRHFFKLQDAADLWKDTWKRILLKYKGFFEVKLFWLGWRRSWRVSNMIESDLSVGPAQSPPWRAPDWESKAMDSDVELIKRLALRNFQCCNSILLLSSPLEVDWASLEPCLQITAKAVGVAAGMLISNGHFRQLWAVCHSDLWNSRWFSCCSSISVYLHPHKYQDQSWQIGQLVLGAHLLPGPLKYMHTWNTSLHSFFQYKNKVPNKQDSVMFWQWILIHFQCSCAAETWI